MMNRVLHLLLTFPLVGSAVHNQALVTVTVDEAVVFTGTNTSIPINIEVMEGYHIQANKVRDEALIPTTLTVTDVKGFTISKHKFPSAKKFKLDGTNTFLNVYDGKFSIKLSLRPDTKMKTGKYVLRASLRYQACDSRSCLFPRVIDFLVPVEVKPK